MTEAERIERAIAKRARRDERNAMRKNLFAIRRFACSRAEAWRHVLAAVISVHRHERAWASSPLVREHSAEGLAYQFERARDQWEEESIDLAIATSFSARAWHGVE